MFIEFIYDCVYQCGEYATSGNVTVVSSESVFSTSVDLIVGQIQIAVAMFDRYLLPRRSFVST